MIYLSAFSIIFFLIPFVCKWAAVCTFFDIPSGRKRHEMPIPPLGGFCIFSVFLLFAAIFLHLQWPIYMALALILIVGIIDDAYEVNAKLKFMIHFIAAFILVILGNAQLHMIGNLLGFGNITLGWIAIPFSIACVVYIQNAINMMDGVDGLAGGNSLLIFGWLFLSAYAAGYGLSSIQIGVLMSCLAGFLAYNMRSPFLKQARIFLGDAGSMALGLMIAWYAITLSQGSNSVIKPISVAWLIGLPIVDSFGLLVARLKEKRPPFSPDRRHFHHHFLNAGFTAGQTTFIILCYSATLGSIGFFGTRIGIPEPVLGWGWIALWAGHTILTIKSEGFIRKLSAIRARTQLQ